MKKIIQLVKAERYLVKHDRLFNISRTFPIILTLLMSMYFYYRHILFFNALRYFTEIYFMALPLFVSLSVSFAMKNEENIDYRYLLSNVFSKRKKVVAKLIVLTEKLVIPAFLSILPLFVINALNSVIHVHDYFILLIAVFLSVVFYTLLFMLITILFNSLAAIMIGGLSLIFATIASMMISSYLFVIIPWVWGASLIGTLLQGASIGWLSLLSLICANVLVVFTYSVVMLISKKECN